MAEASITVDGDPADWANVPGLDLTLEPIETIDEDVATVPATIQVAHDDTNIYVLFSVHDDYDWVPDDAHLSGAAAIMFAVDAAAGPHMGSGEDVGIPSLGTADIWHWELECPAGTEAGGAVNGPGEGNDPGNDSGCNLDDEWATDAYTREDDNGPGAENSILGVWSHTASTAGVDGTWHFEFSRPLQTGDAQDAQFEKGGTALLAVAYWDPDVSPEGWEGDTHVQSSEDGWIELRF